jgi:hypothetical protein
MIDGQLRGFVPVGGFRSQFSLPADFGISLFMPKNYTGLGRIDHAGNELQMVYENLLASIPTSPPDSWMGLTIDLQGIFHRQLCTINAKVGLKRSEIEYAVIGFGQVCQSFVHQLIVSRMKNQPIPTFTDVYIQWLNQSIRCIQPHFFYQHWEQLWKIYVVAHAFGRIGMIIHMDNENHYVWDAALSCRAEGFMYTVLRDVIGKLCLLIEKPIEVT